MCGIVGTLAFKASRRDVDGRLLASMRDTMVHRGPDGGGLWISPDQRVGLGHRRLAIIDLSEAANQPMESQDGSLCMVFNGEIYNHAAIRIELKALGHSVWKTDHSDSEVVLRAFEQWGIACLDRFRGMFALALWDSIKRELWLARDRLGIKPLYYSIHHGRLSFASEIKALIADPEQPCDLDEDALLHFLSFLATPGPETLFRGIRKLPCSRWLRVDESGEVREHRYWDALTHARTDGHTSFEEAAEGVIERLRESVALRKVSDVPVGVFLSGGLDSTSNAALFREGESHVKTYNVAFEGNNASYQNEHEFAREAARFVGAQHKEVFLSCEDALGFLPQMVEFQDEPIADPVCVPLYFVAKLARDDGTIVCQVGEGADELFCGYNQWRYMIKLAGLADSMPGFMKHVGLWALDAAGKGMSPMRERWRRATKGLPPFWSGAEAFTQPEKDLILSDRMRARGGSSWEAIRPHWEHFIANAPERSHLNWMTYIDLNLRLPEMLLMRVDKMTMAVSLEARVPFLDHRLVEDVMGIPAHIKYQGRELKPLLKRAVRGLIPESTIQRKKQGFGIPIDDWFEQRLGSFARAKVLEFSRRTDLFDSRRVESWLPRASTKQIWYLLNLAMWHERMLEGRREVAEEWAAVHR